LRCHGTKFFCQAQSQLQSSWIELALLSLWYIPASQPPGIVSNSTSNCKPKHSNKFTQRKMENDIIFFDDNLNFLLMEDDLIFFVNGRQPQFLGNGRWPFFYQVNLAQLSLSLAQLCPSLFLSFFFLSVPVTFLPEGVIVGFEILHRVLRHKTNKIVGKFFSSSGFQFGKNEKCLESPWWEN
jgi:hypothetical protein